MLQRLREIRGMQLANIPIGKPFKRGVTRKKRDRQIIISLTSHPPRIHSVHLTVNTLLQQDMKPDRVILWLAREQFPDPSMLPKELLDLQRFGFEIQWYHDIRSYKKLVPALMEFPDAIVVTADDDVYYSRSMLRILFEEHLAHPDEIICHEITRPCLGADLRLHADPGNGNYCGTSSYFNKVLGSHGVLYTADLLSGDVRDEACFMKEALTNDDIYFWAMAVRKGTRIRQAKDAIRTLWMTDPENQRRTSLSEYNETNDLYETVSNRMLELYPEILERLLEETHEVDVG